MTYIALLDNHADGNENKDECDDQEKAERCPPTVMLCPGDQSLQSSEIDSRSSDDGSEDEHIDERITDDPDSSVDGQAFADLVYSRKCTLYLENSNCLAARVADNPSSISPIAFDNRLTTSIESIVKHVEGKSEKKNDRDERNSADNVLKEGLDAMQKELLQTLSKCGNLEMAESSGWMESMRTMLREFLPNRACWETTEIPTSVWMEGIRAMEIEFPQNFVRSGSLDIQTSVHEETERSPHREYDKNEQHTSPVYVVDVSEAKLVQDPVLMIEDDSERPESMMKDDSKEKGMQDILANEKAESKEALTDFLKPTKHKDASVDSNRLREDEKEDHTCMDYSKLKLLVDLPKLQRHKEASIDSNRLQKDEAEDHMSKDKWELKKKAIMHEVLDLHFNYQDNRMSEVCVQPVLNSNGRDGDHSVGLAGDMDIDQSQPLCKSQEGLSEHYQQNSVCFDKDAGNEKEKGADDDITQPDSCSDDPKEGDQDTNTNESSLASGTTEVIDLSQPISDEKNNSSERYLQNSECFCNDNSSSDDICEGDEHNGTVTVESSLGSGTTEDRAKAHDLSRQMSNSEDSSSKHSQQNSACFDNDSGSKKDKGADDDITQPDNCSDDLSEGDGDTNTNEKFLGSGTSEDRMKAIDLSRPLSNSEDIPSECCRQNSPFFEKDAGSEKEKGADDDITQPDSCSDDPGEGDEDTNTNESSLKPGTTEAIDLCRPMSNSEDIPSEPCPQNTACFVKDAGSKKDKGADDGITQPDSCNDDLSEGDGDTNTNEKFLGSGTTEDRMKAIDLSRPLSNSEDIPSECCRQNSPFFDKDAGNEKEKGTDDDITQPDSCSDDPGEGDEDTNTNESSLKSGTTEVIDLPQPVSDEENNSSEPCLQISACFCTDGSSSDDPCEGDEDDTVSVESSLGTGATEDRMKAIDLCRPMSNSEDSSSEHSQQNTACFVKDAGSKKDKGADDDITQPGSCSDDLSEDDGDTNINESSLGSGTTEDRIKAIILSRPLSNSEDIPSEYCRQNSACLVKAYDLSRPMSKSEDSSSKHSQQNPACFDNDSRSKKDKGADDDITKPDSYSDNPCEGDEDINTNESSLGAGATEDWVKAMDLRQLVPSCFDEDAECGKETDAYDNCRDGRCERDGDTNNLDSYLGSGATAERAIDVSQTISNEENKSSEQCHQNSTCFDNDAASGKETEADDGSSDGDTKIKESLLGSGTTEERMKAIDLRHLISDEKNDSSERCVQNSTCVDKDAESGKETETDGSSRDDPTEGDGNTNNLDCSQGSGATEERVKNDSEWVYANTRPDQRKDRNQTEGDLIRNERDTKNTNHIAARRKKKQNGTVRENVNLQVNSLCQDLFGALVLVLVLVLGLAPSVVANSEEKTVWAHSGDNVTIDCPLHGDDGDDSAAASPSASDVSILLVRMESKRLPFYTNGNFDPGGTKTESQTSRFDVSQFSEYVRLVIMEAQNEDQDTYYFIKVVHTGNSREQYPCIRTLVVLTPPGKAKCYILTDPGDTNMVIHCNASVANSEAKFFCFQGSSFVLSDYQHVDETGRSMRARFRIENSGEPIRCCSKARLGPYSISAQPENCHDFSWPATTPANTYVQDSTVPSDTSVKVEGNDVAPIEKTTPTSSSSSSLSFSLIGHVTFVNLLIRLKGCVAFNNLMLG